jgi:hypothetical protein
MSQAGRRRNLSVAVSIVGIAVLSYIAGAAVIAYQLPSSGWLVQALDSVREWRRNEFKQVTPAGIAETPVRRAAVDRPGKTTFRRRPYRGRMAATPTATSIPANEE